LERQKQLLQNSYIDTHDLDTIWLISWESLCKNVLLQPILEMKVQPPVNKTPGASRSTYGRIGG
jgi:hypothetical protein